jgi:hypothetical protein
MSFRACEKSLTCLRNCGATVPVASASALHPSDFPCPRPRRTETFAFLFDMNQLFEQFIAEFIRRELREIWQSRGWTFLAQSGTLQGAKPASDRGDLVIVSQVGGIFD